MLRAPQGDPEPPGPGLGLGLAARAEKPPALCVLDRKMLDDGLPHASHIHVSQSSRH